MRGESYLWLIRHAPVDGPRGVIHDPEAPADTRDAQALARVRAQLPTPHTAISSPARRTRETAAALGLAPHVDAAFREQSFGSWTGRRHADIERELGPAYGEFWRAPATNRPPGGESFADQIARVQEGIDRLPHGQVILVVHSGTIRAALAIALGLPAENALRFVIDPFSITRLDRLVAAWRVVTVNQR
jgi:alpha-ribazole phosphatase